MRQLFREIIAYILYFFRYYAIMITCVAVGVIMFLFNYGRYTSVAHAIASTLISAPIIISLYDRIMMREILKTTEQIVDMKLINSLRSIKSLLRDSDYSDYRIDFYIEPPRPEWYDKPQPEWNENWPIFIRMSYNLHRVTPRLRLLCFPSREYQTFREERRDLAEHIITWEVDDRLNANDQHVFSIEELKIDGVEMKLENKQCIGKSERGVEYIYKVPDVYRRRGSTPRIDCTISTRKRIEIGDSVVALRYTFYHDVERCELSCLGSRAAGFESIDADLRGVTTAPDVEAVKPLETKLCQSGDGARGDRVYFPQRLQKGSKIAFHITRRT